MRIAARLMQRLMPLLMIAGLGCGLAAAAEPVHGVGSPARVADAAAGYLVSASDLPATSTHTGTDRVTRAADCAEDLADAAATTATRAPDVSGQGAVLVSSAGPRSSPDRWSGRSRPVLPPAVGLRHAELSVLRI